MIGLISTRLIEQGGHWYIETLIPKRTAGVYAIENTMNGRAYIGSSVDIRHRWTAHVADLKKGGSLGQLQSDWTMYGPGAFALIILEQIRHPSSVVLLAAEQRWLDTTGRIVSLYNARLKVRRSDWNTMYAQRAFVARRAQPAEQGES